MNIAVRTPVQHVREGRAVFFPDVIWLDEDFTELGRIPVERFVLRSAASGDTLTGDAFADAGPGAARYLLVTERNVSPEELPIDGQPEAKVYDTPDTPTIAAEYVARFATQRVLFPCAETGLRTVQRAMPAANVMDLPVYRMRSVPGADLPQADVVIVTSPEHANALHARKPLQTFAHRIAMGTSTAQRIREISGADAMIPWTSNEMALVDAVFHIATA